MIKIFMRTLDTKKALRNHRAFTNRNGFYFAASCLFCLAYFLKIWAILALLPFLIWISEIAVSVFALSIWRSTFLSLQGSGFFINFLFSSIGTEKEVWVKKSKQEIMARNFTFIALGIRLRNLFKDYHILLYLSNYARLPSWF